MGLRRWIAIATYAIGFGGAPIYKWAGKLANLVGIYHLPSDLGDFFMTISHYPSVVTILLLVMGFSGLGFLAYDTYKERPQVMTLVVILLPAIVAVGSIMWRDSNISGYTVTQPRILDPQSAPAAGTEKEFYTAKQREVILDTLDDIMRVAKDYSRRLDEIKDSMVTPASLASVDFSGIRPPRMSEEQERTWDAEQIRSQKSALELRINEIDSYLKTITGLEGSLLNQDTLGTIEYYTPLNEKVVKRNEYSKSITEIKSALNKCRSSLVSNRGLIGKYNDGHLSAILLKPSTCDDIANGFHAISKLLEETQASIKRESEILRQ
jgi:hypothetical protein